MFAIPQCVLTFQVKKKSLLASSAGVWAAVLSLTGPSREWVPLQWVFSWCLSTLGWGWGACPASFFPSGPVVLQLHLVNGADAYVAVGVAVLVESDVQGPAPSPA